jgi:hypothetical protein
MVQHRAVLLLGFAYLWGLSAAVFIGRRTARRRWQFFSSSQSKSIKIIIRLHVVRRSVA